MRATPRNAVARALLAPTLLILGIALWLGVAGSVGYQAWNNGLKQLVVRGTATPTPVPTSETVALTLTDPLGWTRAGEMVTLYLPAATALPAMATATAAPGTTTPPAPSPQAPTPEALSGVRILQVGTPTGGTVPVLVALPQDTNPGQVDRFVSGRPYPAMGATPSGTP